MIKTKQELLDRLKNLDGYSEQTLSNQSLRLITAQQFKLVVDLEAWNSQDHDTLDEDQVVCVADGMEKRKKVLDYISNILITNTQSK